MVALVDELPENLRQIVAWINRNPAEAVVAIFEGGVYFGRLNVCDRDQILSEWVRSDFITAETLDRGIYEGMFSSTDLTRFHVQTWVKIARLASHLSLPRTHEALSGVDARLEEAFPTSQLLRNNLIAFRHRGHPEEILRRTRPDHRPS